MRDVTSNKRGPLVRKGSGAAQALSVGNNVTTLINKASRLRRKLYAEGREADPAVVLLVAQLEERLGYLQTTANALRDHVLMAAPAPRDESEDAWLCANPACRNPLYGMRADADTCSSACRAEVSRLRRAGSLPPRQPRATRST